MTISEAQLASLQAINPAAKVVAESGHAYVYLPRLPIQVGEEWREIDALLSPIGHSGYATRLFLAEAIVERTTIRGQPANWTAHSILGRTWHTWSWNNVLPTLPLPQMLLDHVSALR